MSIVSEINRINTNIANAYTQCNNKGATLPLTQNSANLADTISSIPSGGGTAEPEEKDVNFYDYDGTRLYSYTSAEFLELQSMPENPTHEGLTAQGWNWTLTDAKKVATDGYLLEIGQMYIASDSKMHIYIELTDNWKSPYLAFAINGSATVEWGDGTSDTVTGNSVFTAVYTQHNYSSGGNYVIKINSNVSFYIMGNSTQGSLLLTAGEANLGKNAKYNGAVKKIYLSNNSIINGYAFYNLTNLEFVVMPQQSILGSGPDEAFAYCQSLRIIIIPYRPGYTYNLYATLFPYCTALKRIITHGYMPNIAMTNNYAPFNLKHINTYYMSTGGNAFGVRLKYLNIKKLIIKAYGTAVGTIDLSNMKELKELILPLNTSSNALTTANNCHVLEGIVIPIQTPTISSQAFSNNYSMKYYDFSNRTAVSTLSDTNAFQNIPTDCKIIVPDSLYETWKSANNWSTYASQIIKKSDWDNL